MLTPLEKVQRRAARLTAELDRLQARHAQAVDKMVRAGCAPFEMQRQLKRLQRRCEAAVERVRKLERRTRRRTPTIGDQAETPAAHHGADLE